MLPALLHALAFVICLGVQSMASPLAGSWLFFHLWGCAVLLYQGGYPREKGLLWYACLAWLVTLGASAFLYGSIAGAGAVMWVLAAAPSLALCLKREHLKPYLTCFMGVTALYALGLIIQMLLHVSYDHYNLEGRYAWPLLDPNNAAAVLCMAFLPCVWMTLSGRLLWAIPSALFAWALYATGSKAGIGGALLGTFILSCVRYGSEWTLGSLLIGLAQWVLVCAYRPDLVVKFADSFMDRWPIWTASWPLLWLRPFGGLGLGGFGPHYAMVRTETSTGGWYAHNDLLQVAIECGIPAMLVLLGLFLCAAFTTRRSNIASGVVLLATFLAAMVEFQFYVPAVSLPLGLALAWHILNSEPTKGIR